jgi:pimeloyl-ACP methyl ester carboxylesterase
MAFALKFPCLVRHPLTAEDRLGNPAIKFPICAIYGDQDWMTSNDGPEDFIKNNACFKSGRSQIFTVKNATHAVIQDQPDSSLAIIKGFFDGSITHTWQPKNKGSFTNHNNKKIK